MELIINKEEKNLDLEKLLNERKNAKNEEEFKSIMNKIVEEVALNSNFLSVVEFSKEPIRKSEHELVVNEDNQIQFLLISNEKDEAFIPAFTEFNEVKKWDEMKETDIKSISMHFDEYYSIIMETKIFQVL